MLNLTVRQFADSYIASGTKIRVVKSFVTIFEGTLDELYYYGTEVLNNIVTMVGAYDGFVCLSCREF